MHPRDLAVPPDEDNGEPDCPGDTLKARLAESWLKEDWPVFYGTAGTELTDRIVPKLVSKGLTIEDAEDCVIQALEGMIKKQANGKKSVKDPQSYIWRSAINAANDLIEDRRLEARAAAEVGHELRRQDRQRLDRLNSAQAVSPDQFGPITQRAAVVLTETIIEDIEADESWAVLVVTTAIERLRPALRSVAKHMLVYGPKCKATEAEADIGMKAGTYRPNRSKAIVQLKKLIPDAMRELGINPAVLAPPDIGISETGDFPSVEHAEGD